MPRALLFGTPVSPGIAIGELRFKHNTRLIEHRRISPREIAKEQSMLRDAASSVREALREVFADLDEGADSIIVKPAGPYGDILRMVRENVDVPVTAYQVSGEYSLIRAAGINGWVDEERIMMESLLGLKRAGADSIITYFTETVLEKGLAR